MARTQKVSVALDKDVLTKARKLAAADGLTLSGLLMKLLEAHLEQQARFEAMDRFLAEFPPEAPVTDEAIQSILDELAAPLPPVRRPRRKRAA